ncbi:EF-P lysine aminoacylase EpmA [Salinispirillum sp. LH 10-3-1]|uniref:EF-P lysine aminoacylase EpmA n=1 Tax=Salinispirillum sp. LH 10-3-1 TaxID=2952525 RepID=A0AB38YFS5_9GAMM
MSDWQPTAPREHLKARAATLAAVRAFFAAREVLEVETPLLSSAMNSDPNIESIVASQLGRQYYLNTSPEFPMKRLLAAGYGAIFQLCKVFRAGESGRRHNPEFTMLEWYRPSFDEVAMMDEVHALLAELIPSLPRQTLSYREAFMQYAGFDPHAIELGDLQARSQARLAWHSAVRNEMLDLWLAQVVEPALPSDRLVFITDWPPSMAALARIETDALGVRIARRFEAFYQGMEMANGYFELLDADEQQERFQQDVRQRERSGQAIGPLDERLDQAMRAGLPSCAGVAMGFDRLMMVLLQEGDIGRVISFTTDRA